jgi:hypothetical protein
MQRNQHEFRVDFAGCFSDLWNMIRQNFGMFCLSVAIVLSTIIWALATRYTPSGTSGLILNRMTGKLHVAAMDYR